MMYSTIEILIACEKKYPPPITQGETTQEDKSFFFQDNSSQTMTPEPQAEKDRENQKGIQHRINQ